MAIFLRIGGGWDARGGRSKHYPSVVVDRAFSFSFGDRPDVSSVSIGDCFGFEVGMNRMDQGPHPSRQ